MADGGRGLRWSGGVAILVALILFYLFFWPVAIAPIPWQAPEAPTLEGPYALNDSLAGMQLIPTPNTVGPEDVAIDDAGNVYVGVQDGKILRYPVDSEQSVVFAETDGRPLGLDFDADGNLVVADAEKGLLSIDPDGRVTVLCTEAGGTPFGFTNDVAVDSHNVAWFTDASDRHGHVEWKNEAFESAPNGRLLKYDINTKECAVVLDDLHFANGVAVSPDDTYVLVNETYRYRIKRAFVRGPRAGEVDIFAENLPGFPDGISTGEDGVYWVALASTRSELLDDLAPYPWLRKVIYRLPDALEPNPSRRPFVLGINEKGAVVYNLQDPSSEDFAMATSAEQKGDWLYVGSLVEPNWGRLQLSPLLGDRGADLPKTEDPQGVSD